MPELRVEFTERELRHLEEAAVAAGVRTEQYVHAAALREKQRQTFVATASGYFDRHVEEFDAAFPEDAPARHAA